ncbi:hypothetical protein [Streptomyces longispororuber]|uniref:hypothetical protein n=1 Tax=Streptomyces longispororuber TaxID=68230 RepID=UPI0036FE3AB8
MGALPYGPDLPVVLLTGGPGTGKQQLLEEVRDRFGGKAPVALVDCADPQYEREAGERPSCRSATTETLYDIAQRMEEWDGPGGAVPTPRFFAGMAAVAAAQGLRQQELDEELTRYRRLLHASQTAAVRVIRNLTHGYLVALAAVVAPPAAMPLVGAALTEFIETLAAKGDEPVQTTYRDYPGAAGNAATGLRLLGRSFRRSEEGRRFAEGFLFRALREDVTAAYSGAGARLRRVGRPAILLQHSNWPVGRELLAAALDDWAEGHRGRTVLVASERMAEPLFLAGEQRTEELAVYRPDEQAPPRTWERLPARGQLGQAVLLLRMPSLTSVQIKQQVLEEVGAVDSAGLLLRAQGAVRRLSGHRPRMVQRLAEAAAHLPVLDNDRDLLAHPALLDGAPAPVRDVLLEELVLRQLPERLPVGHADRWLDLLTQLSVAHTGDCARTLLRSAELEQLAGGLTADQVQQYLLESGWPACERHFIGDFGLRQLLMCRLYGPTAAGPAPRPPADTRTPAASSDRTGAGTGTGTRTDWHRNHSLLHAHYRALPAAPDHAFGTTAAHGLNHDLVAGGGPERAIRHLAAEFPASGARAEEWCEELLAIAQAPLLRGPDVRHARMKVAGIVGTTLERQLDQLLHAVWLCEERTRPADVAAAEKMVGLLGDLALAYPEAAPVLADRAGDWGKRAAGKRPLQPCACTSHIGQGS